MGRIADKKRLPGVRLPPNKAKRKIRQLTNT